MPDAVDSPSQLLEAFGASVRDFARCIDNLPDGLWLRKIVNWTPRDVVAHLIGWNVYVREGCDLLRAGKAPAYLDDRPNDFRTVNAASAARYAARDKRALLDQLDASYRNLDRYLAALAPDAWDADTGVRFGDRPVTIRGNVRGLTRDYNNHRQRIEQWLREQAHG
jgi:Mycothiol maleylpyruvate isomerase N-terminal domain